MYSRFSLCTEASHRNSHIQLKSLHVKQLFEAVPEVAASPPCDPLGGLPAVHPETIVPAHPPKEMRSKPVARTPNESHAALPRNQPVAAPAAAAAETCPDTSEFLSKPSPPTFR